MNSTTANSSTVEPIIVDSSAIPLDAATVEPSSEFVDFTIHRLRIAGIRAKLLANEIEAITVALSAGTITPEMAILMLSETGIEVSS